MSTPLVSIIIPVYNGANFMREAIDSALAQTYTNREVIVVNDGSADGGETERIALSYGDRIRYFSKENGGVSSALNLGIRNMRGEYFSWLSHDDVYFPDKIARSVEAMSSANDAKTLILCDSVQIDKDSQLLMSKKRIPEEKTLNWREAVSYITKNGGADGCAFLIPKQAIEENGFFDQKLRFCQDTYMWWKIFLSGYSLILCDFPGVKSRIHDKQLTQTGFQIYHSDSLYIGKRLLRQFAEASTEEINILYEYAKDQAIHNNPETAKKAIALAKKKRLATPLQQVYIKALCIYGKVRPTIRSIFYRLFKHTRIRQNRK